MTRSTWWDEYREVWRRRPWLALMAIVGVVLVVVSLVETILVGPLVVLFIPGLALVYLHHVLVRRSTTS